MNKRKGTRVLGVLMLAMGIGPLINLGLGSVSSLVIEDLGITDGQYGLLSTVCFILAAIGSVLMGKISDRIPAKHQLTVIFGGAGVSMLAAALAPSLLWMLIVYGVAGLGQAMSNPTTNRLAVIHAGKGKQESWIGIKQSGLQASQLFAGLFFPLGAMAFGWRGAVAAAGVLAILLIPWAWRQIPTEPSKKPRSTERTPGILRLSEGPGAMPLRGRKRAVAHSGMVWIYALQICLASIGLTATNVYLPLFAQRELGLSLVVSGLTTAVVGGVGVCARIYWTRRMSTGASAQSLVVLLSTGSVASAVCLMVSGETGQTALMWAGVLLHAGMTLGINSVVMAGVMRLVKPTNSGGATGIVALGMYLGIGVAPICMGLLIDVTGGFTSAWLLLVCTNLACLVLATVLRFQRGGGASSADLV